LPREHAAVLGATLLGERGNLSHEQRARFVRSGTVHLLVVSGLHVGLLAGAVVFFLRILGMDPRKAWAVGAVVSLLYLITTGIQPSVTRATVMLVIYALGRIQSRKPDALNVLGASALVLLVINPRDVAELGFQLSYLSVLGIFVLSPILKLRRPPSASERAVRGIGGRALEWTGASLRASIAVGLCTWPLLIATVHVFSPIMLLSNLVASPLLGLMLVLGLLTPLALIPGVGAALAWALSTLAAALQGMASALASVPYGHLFLPAPPAWWLIGYYVLLAGVLLVPRVGLPRVAGAALWLVWLSVLPAMSLISTEGPGPARVTALDVGQGQCVVIEVPDGPCAVLDCGSTSLGAAGERVLAPYLWERNRGGIDILIISHADADHVNGLPQLFERFPVGVVYVAETFADDESGTALKAWIEERTEVRLLHRGDTIALAPGVHVRCLWPDARYVRGLLSAREQRNEGGLVLELQAGPTRVLLPSDVETRGLSGVLPYVTHANVLFAPHQGSAVQSLPEILRLLNPSHVVVSARESFPAEASMEAYAASGAAVWKTWEHGAVTFELGADGAIDATPHLPD
jgi:competence protein ComEC